MGKIAQFWTFLGVSTALALGGSTAHARSFMEFDLVPALNRVSAPLSSPTTLSSVFGVAGSQTMAFEMSDGFSLLGAISGAYYEYGADGLTITNPGVVNVGGSLGLQAGGRSALIRLMVGVRTMSVLTEPTAGTMTFSSVLSPAATVMVRTILLHGAGHDIGIGASGGYRTAGLGSGSGATMTSALTAGAELNIDFIRSHVPLSIIGLVEYSTAKTSAGTQTSIMVGGGLRFGASLVRPEKD